MKSSRFVVVVLFISVLCFSAHAQSKKKRVQTSRKAEVRRGAVVVDEKLAVVRASPSLVARPLRRLRRGRVLQLGESRAGDGVMFFRVAVSSRTSGWIQSESFVVRGKPGEDVRLFRLVQVSKGFDEVDRARIFLEAFPDSPLRPSVLLLLGDLMEETAMKLTKDIGKRLRRAEMSATGAPAYSFYLNSVSLDRYVKLGLGFVFNESTMRLHYDGRAWKEIVSKFPDRPEAVEAGKRIEALKEKMES